MENLFNILMVTDYSEAVKNAERYAVQLSNQTHSFLRFLHVYQSPEANQTGSFNAEKIDYNPGLFELNKLKAHVEELLHSMELKPGDIDYECVIREGHVARQIGEECNEWNADFIIAGSHGHSGFRVIMPASITLNLMKRAELPVLVIPQAALFTGVRKIVFATEYREGELPVLSFLNELSKDLQAEVIILHISSSIFSKDFEKILSLKFLDEVKKLNSTKITLRVVHYPDIVEGLASFCEDVNADWLVMSPGKTSFLERIFSPGSSFTKKVSLHTKVPILCIPDYYSPDCVWFWKLFTDDKAVDNVINL